MATASTAGLLLSSRPQVRILPGTQFKPFLATVFSHWKPAGEPNAHASTPGRLLIHGGGQRRGADVRYSPVDRARRERTASRSMTGAPSGTKEHLQQVLRPKRLCLGGVNLRIKVGCRAAPGVLPAQLPHVNARKAHMARGHGRRSSHDWFHGHQAGHAEFVTVSERGCPGRTRAEPPICATV